MATPPIPDDLEDLAVPLDELDGDVIPRSREELLAVWNTLSEGVRWEANQHGIGDTVVRDEIYLELKEMRA
jgi:hypothetical protein